MTSEQRVAANRANAKKSTGPRTANGKRRTSRNSLRHGLAVPTIQDVESEQKVKRLAAMICGEGAGPMEKDLATTIAECQVMLARVRAARVQAIETMRTAPVYYKPHFLYHLENVEAVARMASGNPHIAREITGRFLQRTKWLKHQIFADLHAQSVSRDREDPISDRTSLRLTSMARSARALMRHRYGSPTES